MYVWLLISHFFILSVFSRFCRFVKPADILRKLVPVKGYRSNPLHWISKVFRILPPKAFGLFDTHFPVQCKVDRLSGAVACMILISY